MSTIFGHGRLRLYLLKLLDESPRHGYEIISLLRDRFLGVYSPSPGTIYPRLARLEEEGLVTHEEVDGRKVYRLTDRGREELRNRSSDLDDLEREITDSVRDVAEAVREDVRDTISSLREELKFGGAGRGSRSEGTRTRDGARTSAGEGASGSAGDGESEGASRGGSWWTRDWERFTQGFGYWGKRSGSERPEFDQALRDFTDRVRNLAREAGQVGESAAHDLRRILDETFETIRRDVGGWGPRDTEQDGPCGTTGADDCGHGGRHERAGAGSGPTAPDEAAPGQRTDGNAERADGGSGGTPAGDGTGARPDAGGSTGPAAAGDPWSAAVDDPAQGSAGGPSASETAGPAEQADGAGDPGRTGGDTSGSSGSAGARGTGDPWSAAVNDDPEPDERRNGPGA